VVLFFYNTITTAEKRSLITANNSRRVLFVYAKPRGIARFTCDSTDFLLWWNS